MTKALAIKYRPKTFNDLTEQESIKKILEYQLKTGTTKNAYLFVGSAGTGKTTSARIFATAINEGRGNPIEIDAASNSGVDNVREIINNSSYKSMDSKYKIYIIDECHMLSSGAWAAFLKLLEEPPIQTKFIFCTTDPQKIPATILSRVQRYDFQRISFDGIVDRLKYITFMETSTPEEIDDFMKCESCFLKSSNEEQESLDYIAKVADGGMRSAITLLDKCFSYSNVLTLDNVLNALGVSGYESLINFIFALVNRNKSDVIKIVEDTYYDGKDLKQFIKQVLSTLIDTSKYQLYKDFKYIKIPKTFEKDLNELYEEDLSEVLSILLQINNSIKWEQDPKLIIEAELLNFCGGE